MTNIFRRTALHDAETDRRPALRTVRAIGAVALRYSSPLERGWSPNVMSLEQALSLIERDHVLFPEQGIIEVVDEEGIWPRHWPELS